MAGGLEHGRANKLVALFHNLRLMARMKNPQYTEPAIGWNEEDDATGVTKFGVTNYEGTAKLKVKAPTQRPKPSLPVQHSADHILALM